MGSTTNLHPHTYFTKKSVARKEGYAMVDKIIMLLFVATLFIVAFNLPKL